MYQRIRSELESIVENEQKREHSGGFNIYDLAIIIIDHCSGAIFDDDNLTRDVPDIVDVYSRKLNYLVRSFIPNLWYVF